MALVRVSADFCAGGGHAEVTLEVGGAAQGTWSMPYEEIVGTPDDDGRREFTRNFIRLHKLGKSDAALKSDLQAGIQVTV